MTLKDLDRRLVSRLYSIGGCELNGRPYSTGRMLRTSECLDKQEREGNDAIVGSQDGMVLKTD